MATVVLCLYLSSCKANSGAGSSFPSSQIVKLENRKHTCSAAEASLHVEANRAVAKAVHDENASVIMKKC